MNDRESPGIGQVFADAKPPRREWRIVRRHGGTFALERTDKPNVSRFVDAAALDDLNRYRRIR